MLLSYNDSLRLINWSLENVNYSGVEGIAAGLLMRSPWCSNGRYFNELLFNHLISMIKYLDDTIFRHC